MSWIKNHFNRYLQRGPWAFCWRIGIESTFVSLIIASLLSMVLETPERIFIKLPIAEVFVLLVLVAPPIETLIFQALPIIIIRLLKGSLRVQIAVSAALFAIAHFPEGIVTGVAAGIIGGLYFGFAYAYWRTKSRWHPLWITTTCHAIHNLIAFLLIVIFVNLS